MKPAKFKTATGAEIVDLGAIFDNEREGANVSGPGEEAAAGAVKTLSANGTSDFPPWATWKPNKTRKILIVGQLP
jgi:hypothetical protein